MLQAGSHFFFNNLNLSCMSFLGCKKILLQLDVYPPGKQCVCVCVCVCVCIYIYVGLQVKF